MRSVAWYWYILWGAGLVTVTGYYIVLYVAFARVIDPQLPPTDYASLAMRRIFDFTTPNGYLLVLFLTLFLLGIVLLARGVWLVLASAVRRIRCTR